jgi:hypothetical protein
MSAAAELSRRSAHSCAPAAKDLASHGLCRSESEQAEEPLKRAAGYAAVAQQFVQLPEFVAVVAQLGDQLAGRSIDHLAASFAGRRHAGLHRIRCVLDLARGRVEDDIGALGRIDRVGVLALGNLELTPQILWAVAGTRRARTLVLECASGRAGLISPTSASLRC